MIKCYNLPKKTIYLLIWVNMLGKKSCTLPDPLQTKKDEIKGLPVHSRKSNSSAWNEQKTPKYFLTKYTSEH